jgi:uncharacterized membrane protein
MTLIESRPAQRTRPRPPRTGAWFLGLSCLAITVLAVAPYASQSLEQLGADPAQIASTYVDQPLVIRVALYVHIVSAAVALVLSPLQFSARVRVRARRLHRVVGRIVFAAIAVGGLTGLVLAPFTRAGVVGALGFGILGVLWLTFAALAFRAIRRRDIAAHRRWAVRTFAMTYAGVMLRLYLTVLPQLVVLLLGTSPQAAYEATYPAIAWLAWVPNLIVAERSLAARRRRISTSAMSLTPSGPASREGTS